MGKTTRKEYLKTILGRYKKACRKEKKQILDEFCLLSMALRWMKCIMDLKEACGGMILIMGIHFKHAVQLPNKWSPSLDAQLET